MRWKPADYHSMQEFWNAVSAIRASDRPRAQRRFFSAPQVFLSARPHVYKDVSERASYNLFARLQRDKGLYCTPTMLAGQANMETMASMQMAGGKLILGKFGAIRDKKFQNYSEYIALWPEYSAIFVGDNGQGDVMVAAEAIAKGFPVKAAFIHCIIPIEDTFGYEPGAEQKWSDMGIVFFKTYVGAAVEVYKVRLCVRVGEVFLRG